MTLLTVGRVELQLSEAHFWALTPREYRALVNHGRELRDLREQRADLRAGVVAATIANAMGGKEGGGHFTARDFFRLPAPPKPPEPDPKTVADGWMAWARSVEAAFKRKQREATG